MFPIKRGESPFPLDAFSFTAKSRVSQVCTGLLIIVCVLFPDSRWPRYYEA